jgi:hypothetical protein
MKKLEVKPLTEQVQKYGFQEFSSGKNGSCYPVTGEVLVTKNASNFIISYLFVS